VLLYIRSVKAREKNWPSRDSRSNVQPEFNDRRVCKFPELRTTDLIT